MALEESDAAMYTDDSSLTTQIKTVLELVQMLAADAHKVSDWCTENKMAANATKMKVMFITTWQKRVSLPERQRKNTKC